MDSFDKWFTRYSNWVYEIESLLSLCHVFSEAWLLWRWWGSFSYFGSKTLNTTSGLKHNQSCCWEIQLDKCKSSFKNLKSFGIESTKKWKFWINISSFIRKWTKVYTFSFLEICLSSVTILLELTTYLCLRVSVFVSIDCKYYQKLRNRTDIWSIIEKCFNCSLIISFAFFSTTPCMLYLQNISEWSVFNWIVA